MQDEVPQDEFSDNIHKYSDPSIQFAWIELFFLYLYILNSNKFMAILTRITSTSFL